MNLDAARRRHGKTKRRGVALPATSAVPAEINVTPLVDVVLVLLIIFMVMTPAAQKVLGIQVGQERASDTAGAQAFEQLVLRIDAAGTLTFTGRALDASAYEQALRSELAKRPSDQRMVFVVADDAAPYQSLVSAIALTKRSGASAVGVVP